MARALENPLALDWPVDRTGYDLVPEQPALPVDLRLWKGPEPVAVPGTTVLTQPFPGRGSGLTIKRKGGPLRYYRPLEETPGLFRRFAQLPATPEAALGFVNEFGLLLERDWLFLDAMLDTSASFRAAVSAFDHHGDRVAAPLLEAFPRPHFISRLDYSQYPITFVFGPADLYTAMFLQLEFNIVGITNFRKCRQCPNWIALGKGKYTARRAFCSERCRSAWHREKRMGGER